jgi:hypothetical protein
MAWNPKTKIGKVLKTTLQIGGGVLGLAVPGIKVGSAALGVVGRIVNKGTAALAKTDGVLSDVSRAADKVATASKLLQAGVTKKYNEAVNAEKKSAAADVAAVADEAGPGEAAPGSVSDFFKSQNGKYVMYGAAGLAALFLLPKLLKKR